MHATQVKYAAAKAKVQALEAEYEGTKPRLTDAIYHNEVAFNEWGETTEKLRSKLGISLAQEVLWQAEDAMVKWATSVPALRNMAKGVIDIDSIVAGARKHLRRWETLVDICFRFSGK